AVGREAGLSQPRGRQLRRHHASTTESPAKGRAVRVRRLAMRLLKHGHKFFKGRVFLRSDRLHLNTARRWCSFLAAFLVIAVGAASSAFAQATPPTVVSTSGYINGTPLAAHTTTAFDSRNASTLLAFVSSHPNWNGAPVSISGVTDNLGNTWQLLTGPTQW